MSEITDRFKQLIETDDRAALARLLQEHGNPRSLLNDSLFYMGMPPMAAAKSVETAQLLHEFGADFEPVSQWWKRGFGVRDMVVEVARFLVSQGTELSAHAASALGFVDELAAMLDDDPKLIESLGGDDGRPLHFARNRDTAELLVARGADLNARDSDHNSTPTQWLIGSAPEVAKYLLEQGAEPDIFVAAALGDRELVETLIQKEPACLAFRTGKKPFYPIGHEDLGGTILQWTLAFNSYPHQIAHAKGHESLFQFMFDSSDVQTQLLVACLMANREVAERIAEENPTLVESLEDVDKELVARYCWETNVNVAAVRLMLDLGFPIDLPETSHGYSPLHNAAWGGFGELVELLVERGAPVDQEDPTYSSTPFGYAVYCCTQDGRHPEGEYGRVIKALVDAGCQWDAYCYPTGSDQIDEVLRTKLEESLAGAVTIGDVALVERFVQQSPSADDLTVALIAAAKKANLELCQLLINAGAKIGKPESDSWTPMHAAVASKSTDAVRLLIERGGDLTLLNGRGGTIWHTLACFGGSDDMIELLKQHDAVKMINQASHFGFTPLDLAIDWCEDDATTDKLKRLGAATSKESEESS